MPISSYLFPLARIFGCPNVVFGLKTFILPSICWLVEFAWPSTSLIPFLSLKMVFLCLFVSCFLWTFFPLYPELHSFHSLKLSYFLWRWPYPKLLIGVGSFLRCFGLPKRRAWFPSYSHVKSYYTWPFLYLIPHSLIGHCLPTRYRLILLPLSSFFWWQPWRSK